MIRRRLPLRLAALPFVALVAALIVSCMQTPVTGRSAFVLFSDGEMSQLGTEAFAEVKKENRPSRDARSKAVIDRVVQRIVSRAGPETQGTRWEVELFDSEDVNAFALPGGKVGVYAGILRVVENEAGLAVVLGHEIGHVVAKHGAQRMSTSALTNLGLGVAGAALSNDKNADLVMAGLGLGATVGVELPFSRANEAEADEIGHVYMARAGYDPREAPRLWERMERNSGQHGGGPPALLSTHPADRARIAALEAGLPRALAEYQRSPQYGLGDTLDPLPPTPRPRAPRRGG
jgi:predicted Zn-dependent protease